MRNKFMQLFLMLGLTFGLVGMAQAEIGSFYKVNIPFDFNIGEKSFKAGEYTIGFGTVSFDQKNFLIRSADGKDSAIITRSISKQVYEQPLKAAFVFNVYDGQHYLAEVTTPRTSVELYDAKPKSKRGAKVEHVEVALTK